MIRRNDQVTYRIDVAANGGAGGPATLTLTLPQGQEFRTVPAWCNDPADPTRDATPTPPMTAPATPLTADSWKSLPSQTLTCSIGTLADASTAVFEIPVFQRAEVPNGTRLASAFATLSTTASPTPVRSAEDVSMTVSAAPTWDLSTNGMGLQENSFQLSTDPKACKFDPSQSCYVFEYPLLISGQDGGKGMSPLSGPVTFTEALNPTSYYGAAVTSSAAWTAAGADANNLYAPRLLDCKLGGVYNLPGGALAPGGDPAANVRNSGSIACSQPAPGADATVTLANTDWSLYTYPSHAANPASLMVPDNRAYAVSGAVLVEVPTRAVLALGVASGGRTVLNTHNEYQALTGTALDGTQQAAGADETWNNYLNRPIEVTRPGGFDKWFAGVPGDPLNTNRLSFVPGSGTAEGLPGSTTYRSGTTIAGPGQDVISLLTVRGSSLANSAPGAGLLCDVWDNTRLQLHARDYPATTTGAPSQVNPSGGKAVWFCGSYYTAAKPDYTVQYASTPTPDAADTGCREGTWYDDPAQVPGNDPALAAQGIYTAVNQVRIWTTIEQPAATAGGAIGQFYSIGLRVVEGQQAGDILPNWAASTLRFGSEPNLDALLAQPATLSQYNPTTHAGAVGDRLIYGPAYVRVAKSVLLNGGTTELANATAGDSVTWRLQPKLTSGSVAISAPQPVVLEDCLPVGFVFESATVPVTVVKPAPAPAGAGITCSSGTYLRLDVGNYAPNAAIPPVDIVTRISAVTAPGTYTNTVTAQTLPSDPSPASVRTDTAQVAVQQIAGLKLEKTALTPMTQVNAAGLQNPEPNVWQIDVLNQQSPRVLTNLDVIDVLPSANGVNGSRFSGTMAFASIDITLDPGVRVLYTSSATVNSNPADATNGAGGIAWCDAPSGGSLVLGSGACPSAPAEVTGLRFMTPGEFAPGARLQAKITMVPSWNVAGDVYINAVEARAEGLLFNVGPIKASEQVVDSQIGAYVWYDLDGDGTQGTGEPPVAGFPVTLQGVDDRGNQVSLSTTTDASGAYLFDSLRAGTYTVTFPTSGIPPLGMAFTQAGAGDDRALDSDGDPATGQTAPISLAANQARSDIDQGIAVSRAALGDRVWSDLNANGVQDADEPGVAGFTVNLTGTDFLGNPVTRTTTTDASGLYLFDALLPGTYRVTFDPASLEPGQAFTQTGAGTAETGSDAISAGEVAEVELKGGERRLDLDAGIVVAPSVTVGDFVWHDLNGDGVQSADEPGLAGVQLTLTGPDGAPVTDITGQPVGPVTTDASGAYVFANIPALQPGQTYTVTVQTPDGYQATAANAGDPSTDSSTGSAASVADLSVRGARDLTLDFGFVLTPTPTPTPTGTPTPTPTDTPTPTPTDTGPSPP